ncbi:MAG TPA: hypothetical protein VN345_04840 [Blastocatellia bacterium]|nr:hypothetical protein [Blastocatellia bacterium]
MSEHESAEERYEAAIRRFQGHLKRAEDGTFRLDVEDDGKSIGVDPIVFADLKRSLEETNRKIRSGEIDPKQVEDVA